MTPDQLSNIKYGRSLLTGSISIQDINRRQAPTTHDHTAAIRAEATGWEWEHKSPT